tara:strand:+ start:7123 stop:7701 length:579 start_codon:yes stop_codon:yes gene_type:complete
MIEKITEKIKGYSGRPPVEELRKAAVLIALTDSNEPELIYTLRSNKVGSHGGEVSFPGGMYEDVDKNLEHTALRESEEETGMDSSKVNILGPIDTVVSRYNISVTPYVGIVPENVSLNNKSEEIESCFKVPLSFLLKDERHRNDEIKRDGDIFFMPAYQYDSYIIWGLTAMMTVDFLNIALEAKIDLKTKGN